ncbi:MULTISPECIES: hypothetical protein [unclassified Kitasatospora]
MSRSNALGADSFAAAYEEGRGLDRATAATEVDPASMSGDQRTH